MFTMASASLFREFKISRFNVKKKDVYVFNLTIDLIYGGKNACALTVEKLNRKGTFECQKTELSALEIYH